MTKKLKRKTLIAIVIFLLVFNLLSLPMWLIIHFGIVFPKTQTLLAIFLEYVLNFLKIETNREEFVLLLTNSKLPQIVIDADCIGWKSAWMFCALVLATPIKIRKKSLKNKIEFFFAKTKLKALAIGVPILFVLNFLRILTTILIGYYFGIGYFNIVHTILWREGLIFAVILIWFLWLRKEKINKKIEL